MRNVQESSQPANPGSGQQARGRARRSAIGAPLRASTSSAQWLRQIAAAVRVHFTWWGVHRSLTDQQKEEVGLACAADSRLLTAGKKLIDTRNENYRKLTSLRSRIAYY